MSSKSELRTEARDRRAELARACPDFARRIAVFADQIQMREEAVVASYWPVRDEADPRGLMKVLEARGAALALPRIDAKHAALSFRAWRDGDALIDNHHRIPEPSVNAKILSPGFVLVPLLAFDALGHRLGYGGGYYDRTLCGTHAVTVGVAYAGQEVGELPREAHDHPLDMIVTEKGLRRFTTHRE